MEVVENVNLPEFFEEMKIDGKNRKELMLQMRKKEFRGILSSFAVYEKHAGKKMSRLLKLENS